MHRDAVRRISRGRRDQRDLERPRNGFVFQFQQTRRKRDFKDYARPTFFALLRELPTRGVATPGSAGRSHA